MSDLDTVVAKLRDESRQPHKGEVALSQAEVALLLAALDRAARPSAETSSARDEGSDDDIVDLGEWYVPKWVVRYADELATYMAALAQGGSWSIGGVQSAGQSTAGITLSAEQRRIVAGATPGPYNCIASSRSNLWHIETAADAPVAGLPICSIATGKANAHLVYEGITLLWNASKKATPKSR